MTRLLALINKPFAVIRNCAAIKEHKNNLLKVNLLATMSTNRNKSDSFGASRFGKRLQDKVAVITASTDG